MEQTIPQDDLYDPRNNFHLKPHTKSKFQQIGETSVSNVSHTISFWEKFSTLESAIESGKIYLIEYLIENGSYTNIPQFCISKLIAHEDRPDILLYLKSKGYDLFFNDCSMASLAAEHQHYETLQMYCNLIPNEDHPGLIKAFETIVKNFNSMNDFNFHKTIISSLNDKFTSHTYAKCLDAIQNTEFKTLVLKDFLEKSLAKKDENNSAKKKLKI